MNNVLSLIDQSANYVQRRHVQLQQALSGLFAMSMDTAQPLDPLPRERLRVSGHLAVEQAAADILNAVEANNKSLMRLAVQNAGLTGTLSDEDAELIAGMLETSINGVMSSLYSDLSVVRNKYREFVFDFAVRQRSGMPVSQARAEASQGKVSALKFHRADRAGKRWETSLYSRTSARLMALRVYVESYLLTLVKRDMDVAMVWYVGGGHEDHTKTFSITGRTPNLPVYHDIADEIWHPNSGALVSH